MKVIKKRRDHVPIYRVKCYKCGSLLEYEENDIEENEIMCPMCRVYIKHKENNIL